MCAGISVQVDGTAAAEVLRLGGLGVSWQQA